MENKISEFLEYLNRTISNYEDVIRCCKNDDLKINYEDQHAVTVNIKKQFTEIFGDVGSGRLQPPVMHETLATMLDNLPENRPLYKDSGQWTIRDEELNEVYFEQGLNESTEGFIKRCFDAENNLYT